MSPEPPSPVYIPPLVQHTGRGVCWSDVVAAIAKDEAERDKTASDLRQEHDTEGLAAA